MEMPKFESPKKVEEVSAEGNDESKKVEEMVVDPQTGLLTKKEWLNNPNA